ncbi:hypothetical protein A1D22_07205 [Pasteurellaceae bacterium LFhippo2]|nr:hypothetical protein [Pasteurellaceae bacterium LFhippo2]
MNKQPSMTIASVTGHQGYAQGSAYAIETSYLELKDKISDLKCLLVSPEKPEHCPDYIQHIPCKPFSYFEYNLFMIYGLGDLIQTDFCLVVQNDGWVTNGNQWKDEYFNYDYIGAPLPEVAHIENNQLIERKFAPYFFANKDNFPENHYELQNGGFSLRSLRLMRAPRQYNLPMMVYPYSQFQHIPLEMKWSYAKNHVAHVEDLFLCAVYRKFFEELGMQFASRRVAAHFSCEYAPLHNAENIPLSMVLGSHYVSLCTLVGVKKVQLNENVSSLDSITNNQALWYLLEQNHKLVIPEKHNKLPK